MDFMGIMKHMQAMQAKAAEMQAELDQTLVEGEAGGGLVKATLNAKGVVKSIAIDPSLLKSEEKEILEDLIVTACAQARAKGDEAMTEKMKALTGGLPAAARHETAVLGALSRFSEECAAKAPAAAARGSQRRKRLPTLPEPFHIALLTLQLAFGGGDDRRQNAALLHRRDRTPRKRPSRPSCRPTSASFPASPSAHRSSGCVPECRRPHPGGDPRSGSNVLPASSTFAGSLLTTKSPPAPVRQHLEITQRRRVASAIFA